MTQPYGAPVPYPTGIKLGYATATDTTLTTVIPAPGQGLALMITSVWIDNSHATLKTGVDLYSGSTKLIGPLTAPAAGGNNSLPLFPPIPCADNEAFGFACVGSVATISVSAHGYIAQKGQT